MIAERRKHDVYALINIMQGTISMTDIYYADLFKINNAGCLVMGFGKSKTCRNYTGASTVEIATDKVDLHRIVQMCEFNINYSSPRDRSGEFECLIQNAGIEFLLVPWCDSMELKGDKIKNYIS